LKLSEAAIEPYQKRKGNFELATKLIKSEKNLSNKEIASISGICIDRVSPLRRSIRENGG
jgi:hypothetical protein